MVAFWIMNCLIFFPLYVCYLVYLGEASWSGERSPHCYWEQTGIGLPCSERKQPPGSGTRSSRHGSTNIYSSDSPSLMHSWRLMATVDCSGCNRCSKNKMDVLIHVHITHFRFQIPNSWSLFTAVNSYKFIEKQTGEVFYALFFLTNFIILIKL